MTKMANQVCGLCLQSASARWGYKSAHPDPCSVNGYDPCDLYSKISELSKAIECARQTFVRLVKEHNDLVYEMNGYHDPVQKLPTEVISQIFSFCLPGDYKCNDIQQNPLVLGRICHRWRQIAWSAPHLWSTIHVYPAEKDRRMQASLVSEWISRSGQLPLTIRMRAPRIPARDYGHKIDPLLNIIRGISSRWHILELQVTRLTATRLFADGYDLPLQPLQSLVIRVVDTLYSERLEIDYPFSLPRAHLLQLDGFKIDNAQTDWPDTTDLRISRIYGPEVIHSLCLVPQVQSLELYDCYSRTDEASLHPTPVIFSHLKAMTNNCCSWVFDYVVAPSLEVLTMSDDHWAATPESIKTFLSGGHRLRKLTYSVPSGFLATEERDRALQFLQAFQQISTLRIDHDSKMEYSTHFYTLVTNSFMKSLSSRTYTPQDGDAALPFLASLDHFEYCGPLRFDWECLLQVFGQETEGPQPFRNLKTLQVRIVDEQIDTFEKILIDPETAGKLRELEHGRVRISAVLDSEVIDDLVERSYIDWVENGK